MTEFRALLAATFLALPACGASQTNTANTAANTTANAAAPANEAAPTNQAAAAGPAGALTADYIVG